MKALDLFHTNIDEVAASSKFLDRARNLKFHFVKRPHEIKIDNYGKGLMIEFLKDADREYLVAYNSLIVSSWGCFEEYFRKVLIDLAKEINAANIEINRANHNQLLNENLRMTSDALKESVGGSKLFKFTLEDMTEDFAENYREKGKLKINHQAIGVIGGKFSLEDIQRYLSRICFEIKWDQIGKSRDLQSFFNCNSQTATGRESEILLGDFIKWRNQIAHNGQGNTLVTSRPVSEAITFLRFFVSRLDELLFDHISIICKNVY